MQPALDLIGWRIPPTAGAGGFQVTGLKKRIYKRRNSRTAAEHNQETQQEQYNDYRRQPVFFSFPHKEPDVF